MTRILVVDDEPDICENLRDIFSDFGYQVDTACDGFHALKLVGERHYDVALLDLKMPGMDGVELYRHIRQLSAATAAIVVTAYASGTTADSILEAGAWRIMSKPVDSQRLLANVAEALHQPLMLLVDDDRELCDSLWDVMREHGYRVSLAHDLDAAQAQLERCSHSIVLLDMKLPGGSGMAVLDSVRAQTPEARVILITGYRGELDQLVQQALNRGANAVCYKPFDVAKLTDTIRKLTP